MLADCLGQPRGAICSLETDGTTRHRRAHLHRFHFPVYTGTQFTPRVHSLEDGGSCFGAGAIDRNGYHGWFIRSEVVVAKCNSGIQFGVRDPYGAWQCPFGRRYRLHRTDLSAHCAYYVQWGDGKVSPVINVRYVLDSGSIFRPPPYCLALQAGIIAGLSTTNELPLLPTIRQLSTISPGAAAWLNSNRWANDIYQRGSQRVYAQSGVSLSGATIEVGTGESLSLMREFDVPLPAGMTRDQFLAVSKIIFRGIR